jgi:seipin
VEIQSQHVEIYHTYLKIHATFTGLRYFMFHWPIFAAFLGVLTNYTFISMIAFLSWYKFYKPSQVTVHTGYDANAARMIEERRAAAKERILQSTFP